MARTNDLVETVTHSIPSGSFGEDPDVDNS
ncbi:hypothetical protein ABIC84_004807 [Mucilaginibacter sp. 3215]